MRRNIKVISGIFVLAGAAVLFAALVSAFKDESRSPDISSLEQAARETLLAAAQVSERLRGAELIQASGEMLEQARVAASRLAAADSAKETIEPPSSGIVQGKVASGDTIVDILESAGSGEAQQFASAAERILKNKSFRAGQPYAVFTDPATGKIRRFVYEVNDNSRLVVEGEENPRARLEDIKYATLLDTCEGVIDDSLFQAVADIGESPQLALKLVDLFGSEINFIRDLRKGDSFAALIEKRYLDGEYRGYGRILAARFTSKGKTWEAWLFRDPDGGLSYYNSKGENLKKTLLMAPLSVTRLTSKFTHHRRHPILGGIRPHLGVDYAAPTGTPVKAVGDGTVISRGWNGGYGNQVVIRHGSTGMESMYGHLSGFASGLKVGQQVRQGQVIGFVGSTGMSTGPHLDFRIKENDNFINPAKAINPRGAPVDPALTSKFKKVVELERAYLDGKPVPDKYKVDSIVPASVSLPRPKEVVRGFATKTQVRTYARGKLPPGFSAMKKQARENMRALMKGKDNRGGR